MGRARKLPPTVLTISGSDPSGGAGIEADLRTFDAHGVQGNALATLLTAQNHYALKAVRWLDPEFLTLQWKMLFAERKPDVIKIGALGSRDMVRRVAALLRSPEAKNIPVVLDPVLASTSGLSLLEPSGFTDLVTRIFPRCRVITPNAVEFSALFGTPVNSDNAVKLLRQHAYEKPYALLLKGGHLSGEESVDFLFTEGKVIRFRGPRLASVNVHGTGCILASALASHLALGRTLPVACRKAKQYVFEILKSASPNVRH